MRLRGVERWQGRGVHLVWVLYGAGCFVTAPPADDGGTSSGDAADTTSSTPTTGPSTTAPMDSGDTTRPDTGTTSEADDTGSATAGTATGTASSDDAASDSTSEDTTGDTAASSGDSSTGSALPNCAGTFATVPEPPVAGQQLMVIYETDTPLTNVDFRLDGQSAGGVTVMGGGPFTFSVLFDPVLVPVGPATLELFADEAGAQGLIEACELVY